MPREEDYGNLLTVDAAQLLVLVPEFGAYVGHGNDRGVLDLLEAATQVRGDGAVLG